MAFFSKVGNILRQATNKNVSSDLLKVNSSIFQAVRCMSSSKVFIGGVSYSTDDQSLKEAFARYGEVLEARIIMDRETGRSRGFGFVTFTSSEEASSAIQALDGQELHGRRVKVNYANERPRSNFGGDGYGGGGYGGGGGGYGGGDGGYGGGGGSNYTGGAPAYETNNGAGGGYGGAPGYDNTSIGGYGGGAPGYEPGNTSAVRNVGGDPAYDNTSAGGYGGRAPAYGNNTDVGGGAPVYGNTTTAVGRDYGEAVNGGYNFSNEGGYGGTTEPQVGSGEDHFASNPSSGGFTNGSDDYNVAPGNFQDDDGTFGKAEESRN